MWGCLALSCLLAPFRMAILHQGQCQRAATPVSSLSSQVEALLGLLSYTGFLGLILPPPFETIFSKSWTLIVIPGLVLAPHCIPVSTSPDAAAAKSVQSCPTLCDPIDDSPPGYTIPGNLQSRTLEWVAIFFSNAWKWKVKVKSFSCVRLLATPRTAAYQTPPSMGFSRQEYWSGSPVPSLSTSPNLLVISGHCFHPKDVAGSWAQLYLLVNLLLIREWGWVMGVVARNVLLG